MTQEVIGMCLLNEGLDGWKHMDTSHEPNPDRVGAGVQASGPLPSAVAVHVEMEEGKSH